jgi:hypothetical protein
LLLAHYLPDNNSISNSWRDFILSSGQRFLKKNSAEILHRISPNTGPMMFS